MPIPVSAASFCDSFENQAETSNGARPRSTAGNNSNTVQANSSLGKLISTSRLPAMASRDRCPGLAASSSISPWRGSISMLSRVLADFGCPAQAAFVLGAGRLGAGLRERVAKLLFLGIVKRCLEHGASRVLNLPQHLVGGHVLDEHEQRGIAGLHACGEFLHEGVIDAVVRQGAAERSGSRAERNTKDGIEEDHADQKPPEAARYGAYRPSY